MTPVIRCLIAAGCLAAAAEARAGDLAAVAAVWKDDLAKFDDVVGEFVSKSTVKTGGQVSTQEHKMVAKKLGPNRLAYLEQKPRAVSAANTKYAFAVSESGNGGWLLQAYGLLDEERVAKPLRRLNDMSGAVHSPYDVAGFSLLSNLDAFRIEQETDDTLTIVSTRDLVGGDDRTNRVRLWDVTVQLDKKNRYLPIAASYRQHVNKTQGRATVDYKTAPPVGDRQTATITTTDTYELGGSSTMVIELTSECVFQFRAGLKDADFRLTAYDIAEPSEVVWEKPTPTYVWLLRVTGGFSGIALLAAAIEYARGRRTRQVPAGGGV